MEIYPRVNPPLISKDATRVQRLTLWVVLVIALGSMALFAFVFWTMQKSMPLQQEQAIYKSVTLRTVGTQVTFDIPSTWSVYSSFSNYGKESLLSTPTGAAGQTSVDFSEDKNAQVDFYFARDDVVDWELIPFQNTMPGTLSKERVAEFTADVVTTNLAPGDYVKFGTRGKAYYVQLPGPLKTLVIDKKILGDAEFESGFKHMMSTMQFIF